MRKQRANNTQILSSLQHIASMMDAEGLDAPPFLDIAAPSKDSQPNITGPAKNVKTAG